MMDTLAIAGAEIAAASKHDERPPCINFDALSREEKMRVWNDDYLRSFCIDGPTMCLQTSLWNWRGDQQSRSERFKIAQSKRECATEMRLERPR